MIHSSIAPLILSAGKSDFHQPGFPGQYDRLPYTAVEKEGADQLPVIDEEGDLAHGGLDNNTREKATHPAEDGDYDSVIDLTGDPDTQKFISELYFHGQPNHTQKHHGD